MAPIEVTRATLPAHADQYEALAAWIARTAPPLARVVDIGSGDGDDEYSSRVRGLAGCLVGVDPSPTATPHANLDYLVRSPVEQYARDLEPSQRFDVALAIYVAEHVREPLGFLLAAHGVLRPGGALFVLTPNRWHYFGLAARISSWLGVDEAVLALLRRGRSGRRAVEHHPLVYRMNTLHSLRRCAARAGFTQLEVRHLDNPKLFVYYFPRWAARLPSWYSRAVYSLGLTSMFGTLLCRLTARAVGPPP